MTLDIYSRLKKSQVTSVVSVAENVQVDMFMCLFLNLFRLEPALPNLKSVKNMEPRRNALSRTVVAF